MSRLRGSHVDFSDVRVYGENLYYPLVAIRRMGRTIRVRRSGRGGSFFVKGSMKMPVRSSN